MQEKITIEITADIKGNSKLAAESFARFISNCEVSDDESFSLTVTNARVI
jgi:hypothetical protein